ncbi:hypothetical protein [Salinibacter ruber]|uniref:Uncharacterized protein n=1 Tax=Salinibacter ruber TaxID=146919 RepID=A0A9X2Q7W3_9BACT|nr:hypothetical protein [Salinibacter ruber]MCS3662046.1 hypothetical protein [Salinibacter ruber]MCS3711840.1 hypothetical protein [Salinibacter ruber]MCS4181888.1 hypothetical protein [Salinibacter ruber]
MNGDPDNADSVTSPNSSASADPATSVDPTGTWHITWMEMWGEDYLHRETQAYIQIDTGGPGDFQFGLVSGSLDGHVEELDPESRFTFTWEGRDEMHPVSGGGWLCPKGNGEAEGMIKIHRGDRSRLKARRPLQQ